MQRPRIGTGLQGPWAYVRAYAVSTSGANFSFHPAQWSTWDARGSIGRRIFAAPIVRVWPIPLPAFENSWFMTPDRGLQLPPGSEVKLLEMSCVGGPPC